jgi:hypothetical protein
VPGPVGSGSRQAFTARREAAVASAGLTVCVHQP